MALVLASAGGESFADRGAESQGRFALMADAGAPDGFMAAVMVRASPRWRVHAGAGHNTMSLGARAGVRVDAVTSAVSPFVAFELGYYGAGDAQPWARSIASGAGLDRAELDRVSYRFGNTHVGLRFGDARASLFLQGGASHMRGTLYVSEMRPPEQPLAPAVEIRAQTVLSGWVPSGRLGFVTRF